MKQAGRKDSKEGTSEAETEKPSLQVSYVFFQPAKADFFSFFFFFVIGNEDFLFNVNK